MSADRQVPTSRAGRALTWARRNLFRTWLDTVTTVVLGTVST